MSTFPDSLPSSALPQTQPPAYTLFDSRSVALATFLGTPVAGATLMAVNDNRLGRAGRAVTFLLVAIVVTAVVILISWNIPGSASFLIGLVLMMGMAQLAVSTQGNAVKEHVAQGGRLGSRWIAFGVGMAFFAALTGVVVVTVVLPSWKFDHGPKVLIGTKDEVYYSGSSTQAQAQALGNVLKSSGYFADNGVTVLLDKGAAGTVVAFVVKEGIWDKPDMVESFDEMGREVAPVVGGFPVEVRLLNKNREVKRTTTVGQVNAGNDHVYYMGTATDAEGHALARALTDDGFFEGKGTDVFVSKQTDGTTLSFVVGDGVWDDPSMIAAFQKIAREVAPSIGGLPLHLHFVNTSLEVKKDLPLS